MDADCPTCGGIVREAIPDPIDAYLASPEAVEQLARALHRVQNPDGGQCSDLLGKHGFSADVLAAALRKVWHDDERGVTDETLP